MLIAVALVSYSAISKGPGISLRLGVSNAAGSSFVQGGQLGTVEMGRSGTIVKPVDIPASAPLPHTPSTYTVGNNDDLRGIANRFHVSADQIRWSNPRDLTDTDEVKIGEKLTLPPVPGVVVTLQKGDTLQSISQTWHIDQQTILDFNYIRNPGTDLVVGKVLVLPGARGPLLPSPSSQPPPVGLGSSGLLRIGGPAGTVVDNHFPYGQCTWYVASRVYIPWMGDAWSWYYSAKAYGWPVGAVPRSGSIMVTWESRVFGHVAYVEHPYADGSWLVSEMNYSGWGVVDQRVIHPGGVPLIGFVYPPGT